MAEYVITYFGGNPPANAEEGAKHERVQGVDGLTWRCSR